VKHKVLMAAAIAGLALGAVAAHEGEDHSKDKGKCFGINSCTGKGQCATKEHTCAGMNTCKGKGWIKLTKAECEKKGGKFDASKPDM